MPAKAGDQTSRRRKWLTAYAPLIIWTAITLGLGSGGASMAETSRFIRPLLEFLFPFADSDTLYLYHAAIRKLAHIFQYGVLGILAFRAFGLSKRRVLYSIGYVGLIGSLDEINQALDPSRTSSIFDVLLDLIGGALGITGYRLVFLRRRNENSSQDQSFPPSDKA